MSTTAKKPNSPKPNPSPEQRARGQRWVWIAVGAVVLLVGGVTAGLMATSDDDTAATTTVEGGGCPDASRADTVITDGGASPGPGETQPVRLTGVAIPELPASGPDPADCAAAPTLAGFDFDGTPVQVDPAEGPVMLVFLAHWCPHCNREVPQLMAWKASGAVPAELQVIAVTTAISPDREHFPPSSWIRGEMGWDWPVLADDAELSAARAFGLSGFPYTVVLDTEGRVVSRWSGEIGEAGVAAKVSEALSR